MKTIRLLTTIHLDSSEVLHLMNTPSEISEDALVYLGGFERGFAYSVEAKNWFLYPNFTGLASRRTQSTLLTRASDPRFLIIKKVPNGFNGVVYLGHDVQAGWERFIEVVLGKIAPRTTAYMADSEGRFPVTTGQDVANYGFAGLYEQIPFNVLCTKQADIELKKRGLTLERVTADILESKKVNPTYFELDSTVGSNLYTMMLFVEDGTLYLVGKGNVRYAYSN